MYVVDSDNTLRDAKQKFKTVTRRKKGEFDIISSVHPVRRETAVKVFEGDGAGERYVTTLAGLTFPVSVDAGGRGRGPHLTKEGRPRPGKLFGHSGDASNRATDVVIRVL